MSENNNNNNNEIANNNDLNDALGPVITVAGELSDFLLHGHLSIQISSDLARESINWQKNCYDVSPIPVYVEANFVRLDPSRHLMLDFVENNIHRNKNNASSDVGGKRTSMQDYNSSPLKFRQSNVTSAANSLKRHHSFNTTGGIGNSIRSGFGTTQIKSKPINDATATIHQSISRNSASTSPTDQNYYSINYPQLFKLIGRRYCLNNGARILLNSYWIESNYDLESYNSQIRDDLLNWFQKILTITAFYNQFGLSQDFSMDFFVVIVIRNQITSIGSMSHMMSNQHQQQLANKSNTASSSGEQLLNLSNLVHTTENTSATNQSNKSARKSINNNLKKNQQTSSSSNTTGGNSNSMNMKPTYLTHQQLADQIRNDLLVCFQLFRQTHLANGTLDHAGIPADNSIIAAQLLERIIIFDSTSNSSQNNDSNSNTMINNNQNILSSTSNISAHNNSTNSLPPTNPILSSTARTFSALSNFSASSIKINPSSMMSSMSPTRNINRTKTTASILSGTSLSSSSSSLVTMPTTAILNYSQFIMRIRHFLLEFHSKQFECYEKLIRLIRDLRNEPQWDFFGFFLLQEELAFAYESLGLYDKALIQYDELDALFSQLIRDASHHGGFGAPMWLRKRLMPHSNQDDDDSDFDNYDNFNYDDHKTDNRMKKSDGDIKKSNNYHVKHQHHHGWAGLCLCNQKSSLMLRMSILQSILVDYNNQLNDQIQSNLNDSSAQKVNNINRNRTISENIDDCNHPLSINNNNTAQCHYSYRISLLDFRNYLYSRQCHLLCLLNKPWELASRALPFLQTAVAELNMLEISMPPGGVACWVFLSVLEILHKCERYSDSSQLNSYSYHTVGLWSYARDNLIELGKICKLMPEFNNNDNNCSSNSFKPMDASEHLHRMIELIAGMGTDPHIKPSLSSTNNDKNNGINDNNWMSPQERLKDALSSSDSFLRHYLEITELTMGTYKHVGHVRCARSIARQLAELYLKLYKPQQALPFLLDLYNLFQIEHWPSLRKKTLQLLAQCLKQLYFKISNSINIQNQVSDSNVDSVETDHPNGSSLTLIIRSACRAYLLLLLHEPNENQNFHDNNDFVEHQKIEYLNAMQQMIDHFNMREQQLTHEDKSIASSIDDESGDSSSLVIHNSYSDLLHLDAGLSSCGYSRSLSNSNQLNSMECDGPVVSSLNSSNSNLQQRQILSKFKANSTENLNKQQPSMQPELILQQKQQRHHSNDQLYPINTNNIQDQCTIDSNSPINYHYPNHKLMDFISIENIEISCDQSSSKMNKTIDLTNRNSSTNNNSQSFIAGSILKLKLKLHSRLNLKLELKKIQITLRFHRNDPLGSGLSSQKTCYHKKIETFPMAQVESCFSQTHKTSSVKCLNETQILKRFDVGAVNSVGSYHRSSNDGQHNKFIISQSSIPISLLNQRLSQDDNYKYFRYLSAPLKFEASGYDNGKSLNMINGINEYELQFQTNENLYAIVQQFNLLLDQKPKSTQQKSSSINDLWFNLDQLILFNKCDYSYVDSLRNTNERKSLNFLIIEDFGPQIPNTINTMMMNSFRLVKCPPSIELIPLSCHESSSPDVITLKQQQPHVFKNCFIGFPQLMCLNLNSGTSHLPQGLKFFIEIQQLSSDGKNQSMVATDSSKMIHVSLHKKDVNNDKGDNDNLEINNFCLDRSLEPFETYELLVLMRSSYSNKKQLQIKGNNSNQSLIYHPISNKQSVNDKIDQYEFRLSVFWNKSFKSNEDENFNASSSIKQSSQTISCQFTLADALHVQPKLCTAGPHRKLFRITIESSKRLPTAFELYFCHPQLMAVENKDLSSSSCSSLMSNDKENKFIEPIEVVYSNGNVEEIQKDSKNFFKYKLSGYGNKLSFTWSIETRITTCIEFNFDLKFRSIFNSNDVYPEYIRKSFEVNIPYEVSIMYDWHTRYVIRQWIEPLIRSNSTIPSSSTQAASSLLKNNSETIRVGNPCLLYLKIGRHFNDSLTDENNVPEEYIMYELICDPKLWLFVSTWNPISATTLMNNNIDSSDQQQNDSIQNDDNDSINQQQQNEADSTPKPIKFGGFKKNLETEQDNPVTINSGDSVNSFQTAFEIIPLAAGFIPLPKVRIAKYQSEEFINNDQSVQSKLNSTNNNQESQQQSTKSNNTTIESLSLILAENLSLSGKNWSKYLSPNMARNNQISASSDDRPNNSNSNTTLISNASLSRNVCLKPFEVGQVYNYNRASQIYVLPTIAVSGGSSVYSNVCISDSSS